MTKKNIIIGNWKMNPLTLEEAEQLFSSVAKNMSSIKKTEVVICPPFLYLEKLKKMSTRIFRKTSLVSLGAQNAFCGDTGAYTGEISPEMLYEIGVKYVILGHSERRNPPSILSGGGGGESNSYINKKIKSALSASLVPILCVGEIHRDENHEYFNLVKNQTLECLNGISKNLISKIIIAYEPVWALSSTALRRDATPADSLEMAIFIRKILSDKFGKVALRTRIIYGGSASERDALEFLKNGGVNGLLPGRASLDAKKFVKIINIAENLAK